MSIEARLLLALTGVAGLVSYFLYLANYGG